MSDTHDPVARPDQHAVDLDVLGRPARDPGAAEPADRVPHQLLDDHVGAARVALQDLQLVGTFEQGEREEAEEVRRRLMTGHEQADRDSISSSMSKSVSLTIRPIMSPVSPDAFFSATTLAITCAQLGGLRLVLGLRAVLAEHLLGGGLEQLLVGRRDAQQLGDHQRRHRQAQRGHQVGGSTLASITSRCSSTICWMRGRISFRRLTMKPRDSGRRRRRCSSPSMRVHVAGLAASRMGSPSVRISGLPALFALNRWSDSTCRTPA